MKLYDILNSRELGRIMHNSSVVSPGESLIGVPLTPKEVLNLQENGATVTENTSGNSDTIGQIGNLPGAIAKYSIELPNGSTYTDGQIMGGLITIPDVFRTETKSGILQQVGFSFQSTIADDLYLFAFSDEIDNTVLTDRYPLLLSANDMDKLIPGFPIKIQLKKKLPGSSSIRQLTNAAKNTGGSGYIVNDILTVSGGTFLQSAKVRILSIGAGGSAETFAIEEGGNYTALPSTTACVTTGGSGTGCKLNLTFSQLVQSIYGAANLGLQLVSADAALRLLLISGGSSVSPIQRIGHHISLAIIRD